MKYKHRTQINFIMFLIFILANSKSFAAPDAGSLLKHEEEIYKFNEAPSLKLKKLPQKEKRKKNISGANKIYVKNFKLIGKINKFNPTHRKSKHANFRTSFA